MSYPSLKTILVGNTDERGDAWRYRADENGREPNYYAGPIPVEDLHRRLFHWTPVAGDGTSNYTHPVTGQVTTLTDPTRKNIIRPAGTFGPADPGAILGAFRQGYQIHSYGQWLITNVAGILDSDLKIGGAGLAKGGAVAWVQVELGETIHTPEGVDFRSWLNAVTSLDGSFATTYQTGAQIIRCDNALRATAAGGLKYRHSAKSIGKLGAVRDALQIVIAKADETAAEISALCSAPVSDAVWADFVAELTKVDDDASKVKVTRAENKREVLTALYSNDPRVAPWRGTDYGVLMATNTWTQHVQTVRGETPRAERNALATLSGDFDSTDREMMALLADVKLHRV